MKVYDGSNDPDVIQHFLDRFCDELKTAIIRLGEAYDQDLVDQFDTIVVRIS